MIQARIFISGAKQTQSNRLLTFDTLPKYANSYCEIYQANISSQPRPSANRE
jgi:hypothetical protein